jgi:hypothetical protein
MNVEKAHEGQVEGHVEGQVEGHVEGQVQIGAVELVHTRICAHASASGQERGMITIPDKPRVAADRGTESQRKARRC